MIFQNSHIQPDDLAQSFLSPPDNPVEISRPTASILIIHHDTDTRLMLVQCLQIDGYDIYAVDDWDAAFDFLQQQPTDLVILDLAISQEAEGGLLRQLLLLYPDIRVVMICDHCSLEDAVDAMKQGAVDFIQEPHGYLQHPLNPAHIQSVIAEALNLTVTDAPLIDYEQLIAQARHWAKQLDFEQARQLIGEAVKQSPDRPEGLTLLGQIIEYLGDRLEALKLYRAAIGLDPTYQPAQQNLDRAVDSHGKQRPCFDI